MARIKQLDQITIDKIAAGEVIERPASIVKELVENAIDANATSITVEIEDGGKQLIRISDNGTGIKRDEIRNAFLRHATSKLQNVQDLEVLSTLGFRGEALSSIAAVSKLELRTKTTNDPFGASYTIEGGIEVAFEDVASVDGCIFQIKELFYNVPARLHFLKSGTTEAGHIGDLLFRMALSNPEIRFLFLSNGKKKLSTSGNGKLKDVIFSLYGRDITQQLLEINYKSNQLHLTGYLGKPTLSKSNRSFETFFVNGRYIKSSLLTKAVEDAYSEFSMSNRFPFVVMQIHVPTYSVDVNVHPTKMEVRFSNSQEVYNAVFETVRYTLLDVELIPEIKTKQSIFALQPNVPDHDSVVKPSLVHLPTVNTLQDKKSALYTEQETSIVSNPSIQANKNVVKEEQIDPKEEYFRRKMEERVRAYHESNNNTSKPSSNHQETTQISLPTPLLKTESKSNYTIIGQIFGSYWLITKEEQLYIVDQHAAHEKVLYERFLNDLKNKNIHTQMMSPPTVLHLSMKEYDAVFSNVSIFEQLGFLIESFGGEAIAIRGLPSDLLSINSTELLKDLIETVSEFVLSKRSIDLILERVALLACKGAVKGNQSLNQKEMQTLMDDLFTLENPYMCPHGRPTIITMTKSELERNFKRT